MTYAEALAFIARHPEMEAKAQEIIDTAPPLTESQRALITSMVENVARKLGQQS